MNILYWMDGFWPRVGGVEVQALTIMQEMQKRNHKFLVFAQKDHPHWAAEEDYHSIPIKRFNFNGIIDSRQLTELPLISKAFSEAIENFKPDIIHLSNCVNPSSLVYFLLRKKTTIPVICSVHHFFFEDDTIPSAITSLLSEMDHICFISKSLLEQVQTRVAYNTK